MTMGRKLTEISTKSSVKHELVKIRSHPSMKAVRSVERNNLLKCTTYDQLKTSEPNIEKVRKLQEHNLMGQFCENKYLYVLITIYCFTREN